MAVRICLTTFFSSSAGKVGDLTTSAVAFLPDGGRLLFTRQVRAACGTLAWPILVTTDEFKYYAPCIARVFGPTVAHVQVKNRYRRDRILRTNSKLVGGPQWRLDFITRYWEDGRRFV